MNRRRFLKTSVAGAAGCLGATLPFSLTAESGAAAVLPTASKLPRWRGFNLTEKSTAGNQKPFREEDFEWIAAWDFDFVRLPMSYRCWSSPENWHELDERVLKEVDAAVELGRQRGVHVNINLHRAPGYCVNPPQEPFDLWNDDEALEACAFHWGHLARRYKGVPNTQVSFDLLNEPGDVPEVTYARVVRRLVDVIRAEDPQRLIIADGLKWGREPVHSLTGLAIAQSTRGYEPMQISHWKANWIRGSSEWPEPTWPLHQPKHEADKERLRRECIAPWQVLEKKGVGVHVGEWGAFSHTPHAVVLAWMRDCLDLWREARWGWAMWNFRGAFGVLDSNRKDVAYEDFKSHKLDRKMLELIRNN
jgi:endoglucanase